VTATCNRARALLTAVLIAATLPATAAAPCLAEGEPIQWVADYCMLTMETDDEIAVSGCIEVERKKTFASDCASNLHFKKRMCEIMIRSGTRDGSVDGCVNDPSFKGSVVEHGGVGG